MTLAFSFEIKVALIGNVSAGKTTVINALFRDKFGEVSMKRTTAGVNFFRVFQKPGSETTTSPVVPGGDIVTEWAEVPDNPRPAEYTLKEITTDNAALRQSDNDKVFEKTFEIELDDELVQMRKNTKLVFVDIPGINEAGSSRKYEDYVANNWSSFDCVVVVMDGRQGVNTEEQVNLLKVVKTNLEGKKRIPVIILCNKVDDPEEEEQAELVAEARREVEAIFTVSQREQALQSLVDGSGRIGRDAMFPIFIPLSAVSGFIFRCGSSMSLDQFKKFDKGLIEKLGRDTIGRALWRKLSQEEKFKRAHEVIMDTETYEAAVGESNFDKFVLALSYCVGGEEVQHTLIEEQIKVSLDAVSASPSIGIVVHLKSAYVKMQALSATFRGRKSYKAGAVKINGVGNLKTTFWRLYKECENKAFETFDASPSHVGSLVHPMQELLDYHCLSKECGWKECEKITWQAKTVVRRMIGTILREESQSKHMYKAVANADANRSWRWSELSPLDWEGILGSITLLSGDKFFINAFGREKMMIEPVLIKHQGYTKNPCPRALCAGGLIICPCGTKLYPKNEPRKKKKKAMAMTMETGLTCHRCSRRFRETKVGSLEKVYKDGEFVCVDPKYYSSVVRLEIPESPSDTNHFGHLTWKYCQFLASIE